jgi:hypothetical protein
LRESVSVGPGRSGCLRARTHAPALRHSLPWRARTLRIASNAGNINKRCGDAAQFCWSYASDRTVQNAFINNPKNADRWPLIMIAEYYRER